MSNPTSPTPTETDRTNSGTDNGQPESYSREHPDGAVADGGRQLHGLLQELLGAQAKIEEDHRRVTGTIDAYNASLRYIEDADGPRIDVADGGSRITAIQSDDVATVEDLHWELVKQTPPLPKPEEFREDAEEGRSVIVCWESPTSDEFQYAAGIVEDVYRTTRSNEYDYAGTRVDVALPDEARDLYIQHGRFAVGSTTYETGAPTERRIGGLIAVYRATEPTPKLLPVSHVVDDQDPADSRELIADD